MDRVTEFVRGYLIHYSEGYDPVKAHEYYLRTRNLTGRSTKGMTEAQREAWARAKDTVSIDKSTELATAAQNRQPAVAMLREDARQRRESISEALSTLIEGFREDFRDEVENISDSYTRQAERLVEQRARTVERIRDKAAKDLENLPPIPENISPERRAKLIERRREDINKIRGTATKGIDAATKLFKDQHAALKEDTKEKRETASEAHKDAIDEEREKPAVSREELRVELSAAVDRARVNYLCTREEANLKYEERLQREYEAIKGRR